MTGRRLGTSVLAAAAVAGAGAAPAAAELRLEGRGFGHGVGLAQWGAFGLAVQEDRGFRFILRHYYPGTTLRRVPGRRIRVLLEHAGSAKVCSADLARDAGGRDVRLSLRRAYRFEPRGAGGLTVVDTTTRRVRARLRAPVRVTGGSSACLRGEALNERRDRSYRGVLVLSRDGRDVRVVNDVALRHYLYGVVPAEMPAAWPAAALRAQAVAARSYALRSLRPSEPWDVLPNQSSQVYGGVEEEHPATTAAVQRTDPLVAFAGDQIAATFFSSSSGGRTAAVEEGFPGAAPMDYLRAVPDPYDRLSPHHDWTARFTNRRADRLLKEVLEGRLVSLRVTSRTPTGRAATVLVTGTRGAREVPAATIRAELGLRSVWFSVAGSPGRRG